MSEKPTFAIKTNPGMQDGLQTDVAIIGGGVSGLYTGWRLRTGQSQLMGAPTPEVHLFEMSDRLGGKLETIYFPGMENVPAHIGGMRYTEDMVMVTSLIRRVLGLAEVPFNMGDNGHHLWYLRGVRLFEKDFEDVRMVPYGLNAKEQTYLVRQQDAKPDEYRTYNALLEYALEQIIGEKPWPQSRQEWDAKLETLQYKGRPIYECGFWNLLSEVLSSEAYKLITDAAGYETMTANVSAGEAIEFICLDFKPDVTYSALQWGYDCLPLALAERFTSEEAGGQIWRGSRLVKVEEALGHQRRLKLTMAHRKSGGTLYSVYADQVVLAMPKRALELIDLSAFETPDSPYASAMQQFRRNREAVFGQPAFKLFMAYDSPWWKEMGFESGRSITDLPIRQCYYFGTVSKPVPGLLQQQADPALLMASYDDASTVSYWRGLEWSDQHLAEAPRYRGQGDQSPAGTPGDVLGATPEMIAHAQAQLKEMHGLHELPEPRYAAYKDWSQDPYGGGWHLWNVGANVKQVMEQMRHPVKDLPLYVTGEAYSTWQGWVEGALTVTEKLLQESFHMAEPMDWLYVEDQETKERRPYYLGW